MQLRSPTPDSQPARPSLGPAAHPSDTMRAVVQSAYGSEDVLELREIETPIPADDEVRIRVRASSVNYGDWLLMVGRPYVMRLAFGLLRPKRAVIGQDVAGEVEAVGRSVTRFRPGDAVFGEVSGAYAEVVCVSEDRLALKPRTVSFEQAAASPIAGVTALQGLRDAAKVQPGAKVLINGASGGVGTFAVQIAKALGAEVTGVCSTRNLELVRSLGADHVVDYTRQDFTESAVRYDAILDLVGLTATSACQRILSPTGVYVSSAARLGRLLVNALMSLTPGSNVTVLAAKATPEDLAAVGELLATGAVAPVIDRRFTLSEVPEALRHQGLGHARGKSVITV